MLEPAEHSLRNLGKAAQKADPLVPAQSPTYSMDASIEATSMHLAFRADSVRPVGLRYIR